MAEKNNHINFSLADIERYLQGRMLPKEMHDLEKAALQDPFLADAIEGYSEASPGISNKHLNEIAAALQAKQDDNKVVPIVQKSKVQWWKIAAVVIVIVGTGTASWLLLQKQNMPANSIVQTQKKVPVIQPQPAQSLTPKVDTIAPVLADANSSISKKVKSISKDIPLPASPPPAALQFAADSAKEIALAYKNNQEAARMQTMAAKQAPAPAALPDSFTLQSLDKNANNNVVIAQGASNGYYSRLNVSESANPGKKKSMPAPAPAPAAFGTTSFQLKGRVLNNNAQPVASALVKQVNGKAATITDDQGFFTFYSSDSIPRVNISSAGYASIESSLHKGLPNTISLKEDEQSLSEVVVTELRSRKELVNKPAGADTKGKEPYPEKGWPSFQEYVYTKLHKEHEYDSTYTGTVTGKSVELEFMVDANGNPYNFKVLHSVDDVSAQKAIEIVKQGPRWIAGNKKSKKAKVTIKL